MSRLLAVLVASMLAGCASAPTPAPASPSHGPSPSPPLATTIAVDCGAGRDLAECLAIVAAASERVPSSGAPGVRAEVRNGLTPDVTLVTFITPSGDRASMWVIPTPIGGYTAAVSINGVTPWP